MYLLVVMNLKNIENIWKILIKYRKENDNKIKDKKFFLLIDLNKK